MIVLIAALASAVWIYLAAFRGLFWRSVPVLAPSAASRPATVTAVVPARDEASSIRACLTSLLEQDYPGPFSVVLVDDNSTDGTGAIAASLESEGRLTIVRGASLSPGWSGKLWAVHQGLLQPAAETADYILLTDADIVHAPGHLSALIAEAQGGKFDLVSEMVRLHCATPAERALIPAFIFFFQMLYPFAWVAAPAKRTAGAAGGTMLMSRVALDRIGGVSGIRGRLIDDCALAKEIKSSGGRIWLGHSDLASSTRVYSDWSDIWNMIARTAYEQLGYSPLLLVGCTIAMSLIFIAPPILAVVQHAIPRILGILTWTIMAFVFQPTLRRYCRSPLWGLALPVISLFYLGATVASAVRHHSGRGGGWKSRVYPEVPGS